MGTWGKRDDLFDVTDVGGGLNWPTFESVELSRSEIRLNRDAGAFRTLTHIDLISRRVLILDISPSL